MGKVKRSLSPADAAKLGEILWRADNAIGELFYDAATDLKHFLRSRGLRWVDLVDAPSHRALPATRWRERANRCLWHMGKLTRPETVELLAISALRDDPSSNQLALLDTVCARLWP